MVGKIVEVVEPRGQLEAGERQEAEGPAGVEPNEVGALVHVLGWVVLPDWRGQIELDPMRKYGMPAGNRRSKLKKGPEGQIADTHAVVMEPNARGRRRRI